MPASSCSFSTRSVASRLARASSAPVDFHGAQSMFGSASHSGFGNEPAIVVGNSMGASRSVLVERLSAMTYGPGTEQQRLPYGQRREGPSPSAVIASASEAIQTISATRFLDCFVAYAPRNDGKTNRPNRHRKRHDRVLFRLLQPLDLPRLPQHPAAGQGIWRG